MKITGIPGRKNMIVLFDPDEIEKVSVQGNNMGSIMLHSVQFIMRPSLVHCYSKLPVQRSRRSRWFAARFPPAALHCDLSQFKSRVQYRGGQLDQIREPHFRGQQSQEPWLIHVLRDWPHLGHDTYLWIVIPNPNIHYAKLQLRSNNFKIMLYQKLYFSKKYFVLKILKVSCASRMWLASCVVVTPGTADAHHTATSSHVHKRYPKNDLASDLRREAVAFNYAKCFKWEFRSAGIVPKNETRIYRQKNRIINGCVINW
jgi:hypothetical protein